MNLKIYFEIKHTFYITGDRKVFGNFDPILNIKHINSFGMDSQGTFDMVYSYSYDKLNWSQFLPLTNNISSEVKYKSELFFKFQFTRIGGGVGSGTLSDFYLDIETDVVKPDECIMPTTINGISFLDCKDAFDPTSIAKDFKLEQQLNYFLNKFRGNGEVRYFRTAPDANTTDPFLNEYSLRNVVNSSGTCIKVVVPDGIIPEPKHEYDHWGISFEKFEIHIDKMYFEEIFGLNMKPREEDFLYFSAPNRLYYVSSAPVLIRGMNEIALYYILNLKKYDNDTSMLKDKETQEYLDSISLKHEDFFMGEMGEEIEDIMNPKQNEFKTISKDNLRTNIHKDLVILDECISNNGLSILEHSYDLSSITDGRLAFNYIPKIDLSASKDFSYTGWINKLSATNYTNFRIISQNRINRLEVDLKMDTNVIKSMLKVNDFIKSINTIEILKVIKIVDEYTIRVRSQIGITSENYKKIDSYTLFKSDDDAIELTQVDTKLFYFYINGRKYEFNFNSEIEINKWYGIVFNLSSIHKFSGVYIYETKDRFADGYPNKYSTSLFFKEKMELEFDPNVINKPVKFNMIVPSQGLKISNIRFWKLNISADNQSMALTSRYVTNSSKAFIIDNVDTVYNLPKIGDKS